MELLIWPAVMIAAVLFSLLALVRKRPEDDRPEGLLDAPERALATLAARALACDLEVTSSPNATPLEVRGDGWGMTLRVPNVTLNDPEPRLEVVAWSDDARAWPEGFTATGKGTLRFARGERVLTITSDEALLFDMIGCAEALNALNWSGQGAALELDAPGRLRITLQRRDRAAEQVVEDVARAFALIVAANRAPSPWGRALPVEVEVAEAVYRASWVGSPVRVGVAQKLVSWGEGDRLFADALRNALAREDALTMFGSPATGAAVVALTWAFDPGWARVIARDAVVLDALDAHGEDGLAWARRLLVALSAHTRGEGLTWRSPRALVVPSPEAQAEVQALAGLLRRVALEVIDWGRWDALAEEVAPALALVLILTHAQHRQQRPEDAAARLAAYVTRGALSRAEVFAATQRLVPEREVVAALCRAPGPWSVPDARALTAILWRPEWSATPAATRAADTRVADALASAEGDALGELLEWVVERGGVACMRALSARREARDTREIKHAQQQLAARMEADPGRASGGELTVAEGQGGELSVVDGASGALSVSGD